MLEGSGMTEPVRNTPEAEVHDTPDGSSIEEILAVLVKALIAELYSFSGPPGLAAERLAATANRGDPLPGTGCPIREGAAWRVRGFLRRSDRRGNHSRGAP
jgi:hypothetical protein